MPDIFDINEINRAATTDPEGFAMECEADYTKKVNHAAQLIKARFSDSRVVLLSGPSGSGKTTTALRIGTALENTGIKAIPISLDKYYISRARESAPKNPDGSIDLESPLLLDLDLLNDHFHALNKGDEVTVPHFSFKTQDRDPLKAKPLRLQADEIVIFEGIHALNDLLADEHPDAFKLYISTRSNVIDGENVLFKRNLSRLLRRVVRDENFRGTGAVETLKLWINVREGEMRYISPFKHKADLKFNSSMAYEVPVMKSFALNALHKVENKTKILEELSHLLPALEKFEELNSDFVPGNSILREFIGGGTYKY